MSPRWIKLWRDLRATRGRMAMIVIACATGIAAVATMLSAYSVLMREVPRNYLDTRPASAQLELREALGDELLAQLRQRPDIAAAERGASVMARIEVAPGEWLPLMLFVVPSFESLSVNVPQREAGAWPPPGGAMLVERSALPLTHASLGDHVTVEFEQGGRRSMALAGTVHDPSLAPAWQEQTVYAYATPQTLADMGEPVVLDLLKIVVADDKADVRSIETSVRELASWLAARGHTVLEARIPPPRMHPHQAQMNAILVMLLIFSLLALLLGALLTATVIGGLLAQQVRQIAIMKAIGARSRQVAGMYLSLVGALGLLAAALGLPLGLAAGRGFITAIAELLNLRIQSVALPWWLFAVTLGLGIGVPVAAALLPIALATRRTVRAAINDHGVSRNAGAPTGFTRALARLRFGDAAWTLALRNTFRRRARLLMTLSLLAAAGAMFITSLNLKSAWEHNVAQAAADRRYDVEINLERPAPRDGVMSLVMATPGVRAAETWDASKASLPGEDGLELSRRYPDGVHGGFALRAAPPDTALVAHTMAAGRWLQAQDLDGMVINTLARAVALRGAQVGDWVTLRVNDRPLKLRVVGITRELLTPGAAYVTPDTFARATDRAGRTNAIRVAAADTSQAEVLSRKLVQELEGHGFGVRVAITEKRFVAAQGGHVYILVFALGFIAAAMAVVGLLGLASSLGTSVIERTREFGVMRAMGARSSAVLRSLMLEGSLIGVLSWVAALALSLPLSSLVGGVLASIASQELSPQPTLHAAGVWLAVVLIGSAAMSFLPARRASNLTVRQTLSHI